MRSNYQRLLIYGVALLIRLALAPLFYDKLDPYVFSETVEDIVIHRRGLYYEGSLQWKFNYFPLAYLAILPGAAIYFLFLPENILLERIMVKLPFILGDLWLANQLHKIKIEEPDKVIGSNLNGFNFSAINNYELFILFNPIFIFISSIKGQFDVIAVIFIFYSLQRYKNGEYFKSGLYLGISIMIKQYGFVIAFLYGLALLFSPRDRIIKYSLGGITGVLPVLAVGAIINLEGMIDHALLFHLTRLPSGVSVTTTFYYAVLYSFSVVRLGGVGHYIADAILSTSIFILLTIFVFLLIQYYRSSRTYEDLVRITIYGYISSMLLNKVLYLQYFLLLIVLLVHYKYVQGKYFSDTYFSWSFMFMPIIIMYRLTNETPISTREWIGDNWIYILWTTMLVLHIIAILILKYYSIPILTTQKHKIIYGLIMILYIANLPLELFLENFDYADLPLG